MQAAVGCLRQEDEWVRGAGQGSSTQESQVSRGSHEGEGGPP